jgi:hypothetical protein
MVICTFTKFKTELQEHFIRFMSAESNYSITHHNNLLHLNTQCEYKSYRYVHQGLGLSTSLQSAITFDFPFSEFKREMNGMLKKTE